MESFVLNYALVQLATRIQASVDPLRCARPLPCHVLFGVCRAQLLTARFCGAQFLLQLGKVEGSCSCSDYSAHRPGEFAVRRAAAMLALLVIFKKPRLLVVLLAYVRLSN